MIDQVEKEAHEPTIKASRVLPYCLAFGVALILIFLVAWFAGQFSDTRHSDESIFDLETQSEKAVLNAGKRVVISGCDMAQVEKIHLYVKTRHREQLSGILASLGQQGCLPAQTFQDKEKSAEIYQSRWEGNYFTPGPTMLIDDFTIFLMMFPDSDDAVLADWIRDYVLRVDQSDIAVLKGSPILPLEAARRYVDVDIDKAMYWYVIGITRLRHALETSGGYGGGMADIFIVWQPYALRPIRNRIRYDNEIKEKYADSVRNVLEYWEYAIPVPSDEKSLEPHEAFRLKLEEHVKKFNTDSSTTTGFPAVR